MFLKVSDLVWVWFNLVWSGLVWFGLVWFGMVGKKGIQDQNQATGIALHACAIFEANKFFRIIGFLLHAVLIQFLMYLWFGLSPTDLKKPSQ